MNRDLMTGLALGLVIGLLGGYLLGSRKTVEPAVTVAGGTMPAQPLAAPMPPPQAPQHGAAPVELQAQILQLEAAIARNPKDLESLIHLGNAYFDTHQPQKAVDTYAKALALDPANVGVVTDQGVMFRELGDFKKALANFERAQKLVPDHPQSLINIGVVYSVDLQEPAKARKAYQRVLEKHPGTPQAEQARAALAELK